MRLYIPVQDRLPGTRKAKTGIKRKVSTYKRYN